MILLFQAAGLLAMGASWLGLFLAAKRLAVIGRIPADWRYYWLLACAGWGGALVIIVEVASAFRAIDVGPLALGWLAFAGLIQAASGRLKLAPTAGGVGLPPGGTKARGSFLALARGLPRDDRLILSGVAAMVIFLGLIGATFPATNWDSLTYHLPRVMRWIQQHSVAHFPTNNDRQIQFGPWAAFVEIHVFLFTGGDRFVNAVQWFAMVSSLVASSLLAAQLYDLAVPAKLRDLENRRRASILAAALAATLPMGLVESMTPQTDYVASFWYLALMAFGLAALQKAENWYFTAGMVLSLGAGLLAKATMLVYAAPVGLACGVWLARARLPAGRRIAVVAVFLAGVLALNGPHWARNWAVYGSPLGGREIMETEENRRVSASVFFSNLIRNASLHSNTGVTPLTRALNRVLSALHAVTGLDPNDEGTTYPGSRFQFIDEWSIYDCYASCFWHLVLVGAAAALAARTPWARPALWAYPCLGAASLCLICAILRWQVWHSRLHLACFLGWMPWTALFLACRAPRSFGTAVSALLGLVAGACLATSFSQPFLQASFRKAPREQEWLMVHTRGLYEDWRSMTDDLVASGCASAGLKLDWDDPEYALWLMLRDRGYRGRLDHVGAGGESGRIRADKTARDVLVARNEFNLPDAVARLYPYRLQYGGFSAYWASSFPRWATLTALKTPDPRLLGRAAGAVDFVGGSLDFELRSPYPGQASFEGTVARFPDNAPLAGTLLVYTNEAFCADLALASGRAKLALSLPAGATRISFALTNTASIAGAGWKDFRWDWK
jgi:4-amino-4-deoxy-L-arabinose transferase-like glycosyltransferase